MQVLRGNAKTCGHARCYVAIAGSRSSTSKEARKCNLVYIDSNYLQVAKEQLIEPIGLQLEVGQRSSMAALLCTCAILLYCNLACLPCRRRNAWQTIVMHICCLIQAIISKYGHSNFAAKAHASCSSQLDMPCPVLN